MNFDDLNRPEAAGTLGAILGALNAPGSSLREQAYNLLAGIGSAIYLAPYIAEQFSVSAHSGRMALAFLAGLIGMNVVAKLISGASRYDWFSLLPMKKGKR